MMVDILPEHESNVLKLAFCCNGKIVANYLQDASDRIHVYDFNTPVNLLTEIQLPDIGSLVSAHGKHDGTELFYKFTSFCDPGSEYRVEMDENFDTICIGCLLYTSDAADE